MDNIQIQCKKTGHLQYEMQVQIALRRMMRFAHHQEAERPDA